MSISNPQILADSSFYLCFLDDINQPKVLNKIINKFDFFIGPIVRQEVKRSINYKHIQGNSKIVFVPKRNLGAVLKPFFSKKQIQKGETEIIELAYQYYTNNQPKLLIIDDQSPRNFVKNILPELSKLMFGTVGFIGECYYTYFLFFKKEASILVKTIGASKFRVSAEIINEVLSKIDSR